MEKTLAAKLPAQEAWNKFIDYHEKSVPKPYWASLKKINVKKEVAELATWMQALATNSPIPTRTVALWIGILMLQVGKKERPGIYLIGANSYSDKDHDWACNAKYLPENRYALSRNLKKIETAISKDKVDNLFLGWILPLAYCAFLLDETIRTKLDKKLFLKRKKKLHVTVGHDDGDYVNVSPIE
jgi:hypothetical protein